MVYLDTTERSQENGARPDGVEFGSFDWTEILPVLAEKVVVITADINGADTRSFLKRTGAKYLTKPFDINAVKRVVRSLLKE